MVARLHIEVVMKILTEYIPKGKEYKESPFASLADLDESTNIRGCLPCKILLLLYPVVV